MIAIGIDGGGTTTRFLIQRNDDAPQFYSVDRSIMFLRDGFEVAAERLRRMLFDIFSRDIREISSIVIGLAGAGRELEQREFERAIAGIFETPVFVHVESDSTL